MVRYVNTLAGSCRQALAMRVSAIRTLRIELAIRTLRIELVKEVDVVVRWKLIYLPSDGLVLR